MLKGLDKFPSEVKSSTKVLFANMGAEELKYIIPVVKSLREAGVPCEIYPDAAKLKKQFDYADRNLYRLFLSMGKVSLFQEKSISRILLPESRRSLERMN